MKKSFRGLGSPNKFFGIRNGRISKKAHVCPHMHCLPKLYRIRYNHSKQGSAAPNGTRVIYWRCADHDCGSKGLREDWLKDMCAEVMGTETFSATDFSSRIDHIDVSPDTELTFIFTNGDRTSRLWPKKKKGHKASEHQKEVMREHMKKRWTPEYRQYMSERMKQIRREKKWPNP